MMPESDAAVVLYRRAQDLMNKAWQCTIWDCPPAYGINQVAVRGTDPARAAAFLYTTVQPDTDRHADGQTMIPLVPYSRGVTLGDMSALPFIVVTVYNNGVWFFRRPLNHKLEAGQLIVGDPDPVQQRPLMVVLANDKFQFLG